MKSLLRSLCAILICSVWFPTARAALSVEITQGMESAVPIAIVSFANETTNVPGNQLMTRIIKNDLQNSGQFRVVSPSLFGEHPTSVDQINFKDWRKKGVNDILVGKVEPKGGDKYQVTFQLVSIYNNSAQQVTIDPQKAVLLNQSYKVQQRGLRQLAHHISDLIYQKLTGVRGIFSTKISYILVNRHPNKLPQFMLMVADADGFNPQALLRSPQPIMSPVWSSNGQQVAYVSFENFRPEIFLQNIQTGQRQLISAFKGINGAPAFSPDGKKMALVLTRTGNPKIYLLDLASKKLTQLTRGYSIDTEPSWAPDGKSLLFTSSRGGNPQIYQYNFSTKQVERLTFDGNYNAKASFMPQEQNIVMMHREGGLFGIARQSLESSRVQILVRSGSDESPSLAPNGKMVIYATQYGGRGVLAMVSTNGRVKN